MIQPMLDELVHDQSVSYEEWGVDWSMSWNPWTYSRDSSLIFAPAFLNSQYLLIPTLYFHMLLLDKKEVDKDKTALLEIGSKKENEIPKVNSQPKDFTC